MKTINGSDKITVESVETCYEDNEWYRHREQCRSWPYVSLMFDKVRRYM